MKVPHVATNLGAKTMEDLSGYLQEIDDTLLAIKRVIANKPVNKSQFIRETSVKLLAVYMQIDSDSPIREDVNLAIKTSKLLWDALKDEGYTEED